MKNFLRRCNVLFLAAVPAVRSESTVSTTTSSAAAGSFGSATTFPHLYSELIDDSDVKEDYTSPLPHHYIDPAMLPESFSWDDVGGTSYLTRSLNQHLPQYCGSCWAHAALSSLADRIKIARNASGAEIGLSVQYVLNCGAPGTGSCGGGSVMRTYEFLSRDRGGFVPYDTCQPYLGCSSNSTPSFGGVGGGFCPHVDTSCTPLNTCRTCEASGLDGNHCSEIDVIPNATVAEYGLYNRRKMGGNSSSIIVPMIKAEIFARGPVSASINGVGLAEYVGGIYDDDTAPREHTHAVSLTGWGKDGESGLEFWIVRNSWGQYWGEMGFFRIAMHQNVLGIEEKIVWATPGTFTTVNYPCYEDRTNGGPTTQTYVDPSKDLGAIQRRLEGYSQIDAE